MTSRVEHLPGGGSKITISCDHISCDLSKTDTEIMAEGGLKKMGWQVTPVEGKLRHYCPAHNR